MKFGVARWRWWNKTADEWTGEVFRLSSTEVGVVEMSISLFCQDIVFFLVFCRCQMLSKTKILTTIIFQATVSSLFCYRLSFLKLGLGESCKKDTQCDLSMSMPRKPSPLPERGENAPCPSPPLPGWWCTLCGWLTSHGARVTVPTADIMTDYGLVSRPRPNVTSTMAMMTVCKRHQRPACSAPLTFPLPPPPDSNQRKETANKRRKEGMGGKIIIIKRLSGEGGPGVNYEDSVTVTWRARAAVRRSKPSDLACVCACFHWIFFFSQRQFRWKW